MTPLVQGLQNMQSRLRYKLLLAFCLMSLLPILVGVYIASLFVKFPFEATSSNLTTIGLVTACSLTLSFLGLQVTKQLVTPIADATEAARRIASGQVDETPEIKGGSEEIEELSKSLRLISLNAKELLEKVERLSMKDKLTGLHNATYIRERLNEEIQRAGHYQRPCSFAVFSIDRLEVLAAEKGEAAVEDLLKRIARELEKPLSEFDRAARLGRNEFALILPDKNKKKAIEIVEGVCRGIAASDMFGSEMRVYAGISENPLDGASAEQLFLKAQSRVRTARGSAKPVEAFA
ncbi:MAG: hypothetical protein MOGMAGMI_01307 [Candidatus Omnitrophica bacterium]|nr:hypothetical protein [Candidatus Omnitrophota bacterium]